MDNEDGYTLLPLYNKTFV